MLLFLGLQVSALPLGTNAREVPHHISNLRGSETKCSVHKQKTEMRQRSLPHRESNLIARSCKFSLLPRLFTLTRRSAIHAFKASVDRPHQGTLGAGGAQAPFPKRCLAPPETAHTMGPRLLGNGGQPPWDIFTSRQRGSAEECPVGSGRLPGASPPRTRPRGR